MEYKYSNNYQESTLQHSELPKHIKAEFERYPQINVITWDEIRGGYHKYERIIA